MAEITTTQTMGNKTITTTINTAARGPKGDPGTNGTDAEVTQANIEAAITNKPGFREEIEVIETEYDAVRDFGVVMDGTTDNTAALQAALDQIAQDEIASLYIPPGRLLINGDVWIKGRQGIRLRGAGADVTFIEQASVDSHGLGYQAENETGDGWRDFIRLEDFTLEGPGVEFSNKSGLHLEDDRKSDGTFNGGFIQLRNINIGNSGNKGFHTGLFFKKWDTAIIEDCRFIHNYRNVYTDTFTKSVVFRNCGNGSAESICWDIGMNSKLTLIGCDTGNAPQWFRLAYGANLTLIGCNQETLRYPPANPRRYNVATTTYPSVISVTINTTTGLFTASGNHGLKPGCYVYFNYTTLPTLLVVSEFYRVLADGFTATEFKIAPIERGGSVTAGSPNITLTGQKPSSADLLVGGKVLIQTTDSTADFDSGEYWIVGKPSGTTITISATSGGSAISFPSTGGVHVVPTTELIPTTAGAGVEVVPPAFAAESFTNLTLEDPVMLARGDGAVNTPAIATSGVAVNVSGLHSGYDASSTWAGRIVALADQTKLNVPNSDVGLSRKAASASLAVHHRSLETLMTNDSSGLTASIQNRLKLIWRAARSTVAANDRLFASVLNSLGLYTLEPLLNRDLRITNAVSSLATTLLPNNRYRVDFAAAGATIVLSLPDDVTAGQVLTVDDEIEIMVVNANGQNVDITQVATQAIRMGASVSTTGIGYGLRLATGDVVRLKCYSVASGGFWQVVHVVGSPAFF